MNRDHVRPLIAMLGLAAVVWSVAMLASSRVAAQQPRPSVALKVNAPATQAVSTPGTWVGVSSCAATSCHGRTAPAGSVGAEYTTFITRDPHARAYEVLFDERSVRMASLLREPMHGKPAHESRMCLDCHAPGPRETDPRGRNFDRSFGVGCEACHGPASGWLNPHTTAAWQRRGRNDEDATYKMGLGMMPMKTLGSRSWTCAQCHVGVPGLEVNHDMIAAGHPRLVFEFSSFHERLPKHWRDRHTAADPRPRDRDLYPDWDARAWLVGQLNLAACAMHLTTQHRAGFNKNEAVESQSWPEFSDFDCVACHQPVRPTVSALTGEPTRRFGTLIPSEWPVRLLPRALELAGVDAALRAEILKEVAAPFSEKIRTVAEGRDVVLSAMDQLYDVNAQNNSREVDPVAMHRVLREIVADPESSTTLWDRAAQTAFAIQALQRTLSHTQPKPNDAKVGQLADSLVQTAWPTDANGRLSDSYSAAKAFSPTRFAERLKQLREAIE